MTLTDQLAKFLDVIDPLRGLTPPLSGDAETDEFGRKYYKVPKLDSSGDSPEQDERVECSKAEANLISSESTLLDEGNWHYPVIDLDIPCRLVPSSTEGHFHLYIDHAVPKDEYIKMLRAMADAGVVQEFYAKAAEMRGATFVRPEWVKK